MLWEDIMGIIIRQRKTQQNKSLVRVPAQTLTMKKRKWTVSATWCRWPWHSGCASEITILGFLSTSHTVQVNTAHSNCTSEITVLGCMPTSTADQAFFFFFLHEAEWGDLNLGGVYFSPRCICTILINFNENYVCTLRQNKSLREEPCPWMHTCNFH